MRRLGHPSSSTVAEPAHALEQAPVHEAPTRFGQCALKAFLPIRAPERREATSLANDQPAQLE
jgi:hypothetical protein